jgi:transposase
MAPGLSSISQKHDYLWTHNNVRQERKIEVVKLLDEGLDQKSISDAVGYSKGQISKIKSWAINEGILSKQGKLTPSGFDYVYGTTKQETQQETRQETN